MLPVSINSATNINNNQETGSLDDQKKYSLQNIASQISTASASSSPLKDKSIFDRLSKYVQAKLTPADSIEHINQEILELCDREYLEKTSTKTIDKKMAHVKQYLSKCSYNEIEAWFSSIVNNAELFEKTFQIINSQESKYITYFVIEHIKQEILELCNPEYLKNANKETIYKKIAHVKQCLSKCSYNEIKDWFSSIVNNTESFKKIFQIINSQESNDIIYFLIGHINQEILELCDPRYLRETSEETIDQQITNVEQFLSKLSYNEIKIWFSKTDNVFTDQSYFSYVADRNIKLSEKIFSVWTEKK